jgi:hypothetical protein
MLFPLFQNHNTFLVSFSRTENIEMTIEEFIGFSSQQEGLAHEDHGLGRMEELKQQLLGTGIPL